MLVTTAEVILIKKYLKASIEVGLSALDTIMMLATSRASALYRQSRVWFTMLLMRSRSCHMDHQMSWNEVCYFPSGLMLF
jgi:hypothetical protein